MMARYIKNIVLAVWETVLKIGGVLVLLGIVDFFLKWKLIAITWNFMINPIRIIGLQLQSEVLDSPVIASILGVAIILSFYISIVLWKRINVVAGEFKDDFDEGLGKWEFGGEGWKTEKENGDYVLSVSESGDGGITSRGFSWSDYQFSFKTKIINKSAGWIVRAESRNKYLMIQLNLEEDQSPKLRFHLRLPHSDKRNYDWIVTQVDELTHLKDIKKLNWIKVKIIVLGSNIDVYLNDHHAVHYFVADPIRWKEDYEISSSKSEPKVDSYLATINYGAGKVGFRCSQGEHAHFREVRVKPM
jgi:hypothetical protein